MSGMNFCDDCGKIMQVAKNGSMATASCSCGKRKLIIGGITSKSISEIKAEVSHEVVTDKHTAPSEGAFPHICSKCGHNEAYVKDLGAFLGDESNVYLFKCAKCGHTDRQADGCSNL